MSDEYTLSSKQKGTQAGGRRLSLKEVALDIKVEGFLSYRDYLRKLYEKIKSDHKYSFYMFSEELGLSYSNVSWLIINGRRKLIKPSAEKVVKALRLTGVERRYFLTLVKYNNTTKPEDRELFFQELVGLKKQGLGSDDSHDTLTFLSEWYHPVIRELVGRDDFNSDPEWISSQLNVKIFPKDIKRSLDLLEKMGLIEFDQSTQRHVLLGGQIFPDAKIANIGTARFHQKMCEVARDSIAQVPARRREINSLTVRLSEEKAKAVAQILHQACKDIMKIEEEDQDRDQIFQINLHLFPLTKERK